MKHIRQQPLYTQVKKELMQRIADKTWLPGQMIPNETQLAEEFGVSQGTVRRALDDMMEDRLIFRKQGVGTFIAEETVSSALKSFFKIKMDDQSKRNYPTNENINITIAKPSEEEISLLQLAHGDKVTRIFRVRSLEGIKSVYEKISLPTNLFPSIETIDPLPDALYPLFQAKYQIRIGTANDVIKAISADSECSAELHVPKSQPILYVNRLSYSIQNRPIEIRKSYCNTTSSHYHIVLS